MKFIDAVAGLTDKQVEEVFSIRRPNPNDFVNKEEMKLISKFKRK